MTYNEKCFPLTSVRFGRKNISKGSSTCRMLPNHLGRVRELRKSHTGSWHFCLVVMLATWGDISLISHGLPKCQGDSGVQSSYMEESGGNKWEYLVNDTAECERSETVGQFF